MPANEHTSSRLQLKDFPVWKCLLGGSVLPLPYSAPWYLGRCKGTGVRNLYMQHWIVHHGNACFTYHFISNNGKLKF